MKLLIDNCLSPRFVSAIRDAGYDVVWAGEWQFDPGDAAIMERAYQERRVLVTRDQDFATLALAFGHRHAGILRIVDTNTAASILVCLRALAIRQPELEAAGIVVAFLHDSRVHQP